MPRLRTKYNNQVNAERSLIQLFASYRNYFKYYLCKIPREEIKKGSSRFRALAEPSLPKND